jgi:hypothetical protein
MKVRMVKGVGSVSLVGCLAILAGCTTLEEAETKEPAPAVQVRRPISDVESLLLYYRHLGKLEGDQLSREHEISRRAYEREHSDFNRVRLAMVLGLPNTPLSDDARALELLEPVAKKEGAEFSALAVLLATQLRERQRLDVSAQDLQQKLDALKSLERSMMERKR